jgi:hypothetical protein
LFEARAEEVFPLLCPVREYEWIPDWRCRMINSKSGVAELEAMFTTGMMPMGKELWTCTLYEPPSRIEYLVTHGSKAAFKLELALSEEGGRTALDWTMRFTAASPFFGRLLRRKMSERAFADMVRLGIGSSRTISRRAARGLPRAARGLPRARGGSRLEHARRKPVHEVAYRLALAHPADRLGEEGGPRQEAEARGSRAARCGRLSGRDQELQVALGDALRAALGQGQVGEAGVDPLGPAALKGLAQRGHTVPPEMLKSSTMTAFMPLTDPITSRISAFSSWQLRVLSAMATGRPRQDANFRAFFA